MVMNNDFVIYRKMLDVTKWNFGRVITFPKKQRFVLGQQIENSCVNCLRLIIEANGSRTTSTKLRKLDNLDIELDVLRSFLRLAHDLDFIKDKALFYISKQIDEVGKMRGGWVKGLLPDNKA